MARRLAFMLHLAGGSMYQNTNFRADAIVDAEAFINEIRNSRRITSFSFTYSLPNPPDPNRILQEPLERSLQEIKAETGRVTMKGHALEFDKLEDAARGLAASGEEVSARFVPEGASKTTQRKIGNHPFSENVDKRLRDKPEIAEKLTQAYEGLRQEPK